MKMYTYDEVSQAALQYFNNDNLAATTWINKYARRDKEGNLLDLTPDDMHKRMAKAFAEIEEKYRHQLNPDDNLKLSEYGYSREELTEEKIYNLFKNFKYVIPAGSVMSGIGNFAPVSLSNCWVIDGPEDSLDDIFRVCNEQSQLMKRRGGVGFDISKLRPSGAAVNNSAKTSTGAASFMDLFSHVTNTIAQNGRRGALMLSCFHPSTYILTNKGWIQIKELVERIRNNNETFKAWTEKGFENIIDTQIIPNKHVYEVETETGEKIKTTADHEFVVYNKITEKEYLKKLQDINPDEEYLVIFDDADEDK